MRPLRAATSPARPATPTARATTHTARRSTCTLRVALPTSDALVRTARSWMPTTRTSTDCDWTATCTLRTGTSTLRERVYRVRRRVHRAGPCVLSLRALTSTRRSNTHVAARPVVANGVGAETIDRGEEATRRRVGSVSAGLRNVGRREPPYPFPRPPLFCQGVGGRVQRPGSPARLQHARPIARSCALRGHATRGGSAGCGAFVLAGLARLEAHTQRVRTSASDAQQATPVKLRLTSAADGGVRWVRVAPRPRSRRRAARRAIRRAPLPNPPKRRRCQVGLSTKEMLKTWGTSSRKGERRLRHSRERSTSSTR